MFFLKIYIYIFFSRCKVQGSRVSETEVGCAKLAESYGRHD